MKNHRTPLLAGNWKMNGSRSSVSALLTDIKQQAVTVPDVELAVFPPYLFLPQAEQMLSGSGIAWGAQNISQHVNGAFTGEISASMLVEYGCRYVIVGHSERRNCYGEDDVMVAEKCRMALNAGLLPVVCVGESAVEREQGLTEQVISRQINAVFATKMADLSGMVIAYEPVWAIGSGLPATPEVAQEVHSYIRALVAGYDKSLAQTLRILYGGSLKCDNAAALFDMPDIDGGLVGGASLHAKEFIGIARLCKSY